MPDVTDGVTVMEAIAWLATLLTALGVIGRYIVRPVSRTVRKLERLVDDWQGTEARPGVPARPGVMERLTAQDEAISAVRQQVLPNGGSSLRDAVDQTRARVEDMDGRLSRHMDEARVRDERIDALEHR